MAGGTGRNFQSALGALAWPRPQLPPHARGAAVKSLDNPPIIHEQIEPFIERVLPDVKKDLIRPLGHRGEFDLDLGTPDTAADHSGAGGVCGGFEQNGLIFEKLAAG